MPSFKENVERLLYQHIIPFWESYQDHTYGGWYGFVDYQGHIDKLAHKGSMLQMRIAWFYARLYAYDQNPKYKQLASDAFHFMKKHLVDIDHGIVWEVNHKGDIIDDTKHVFVQSFGLYAATQYYDSFKDEEAALLAHQLFNYIETNYKDEIGYIEQLDTNQNLLADGDVKANRTMNALLHLVEAYTTYAKVLQKEEARIALKRLLDIFITYVYNPHEKRLNIFFDDDMTSLSDEVSYGHDIEASWLLDFAAEILDDHVYIDKVSQMTDSLRQRVYEKGLNKDRIKSGVVSGIEDSHYVWWVQSEGIIAYFKKGLQTNNETFIKLAEAIFAFTSKSHMHPKLKETVWRMDSDGRFDETLPMISNWKCPYHNGRMCIELLENMKHQDKTKI